MHRPIRLPVTGLSVATAFVLAACSGTQPSAPSMTASASTTATPSETASPSTAASGPIETSGIFTFPDGEEPAVTRELTGIDEKYINPGAVIDDGETLHMFANVFTGWPGHVSMPHLTSSDGATWTLASPEPVLTSDDFPLADPGADVSTGFIADDGTWVLIYQTVTTGSPWVLGLATAPGPDGPWTVDPDPILEIGAAGSWDAAGHSWPSVVKTDDGYQMFFTGFDKSRASGGIGAIGLATSTDGVTWTKRDEPVLTAEAEWEGGSLDRPRAVVTPDGLLMVYAGRDLTDRGLAQSSDGVSWERQGDAPVLTDADLVVAYNCWDAALVYRDGTLTYYLEIGGTGSSGTQVYRLTAELP
jgi:predicted GH43/DUF377 family glycosyl hydrolase